MLIAIIGILIFLLSAGGAYWRVRSTVHDQPRQVQVLYFMVYFWVLAFVLLVLVSLGYWLLTR